jgi:FkbM family methyltransferase
MNYYRFLRWKVKIIQILIHSRRINSKLASTHQKGLFLDCGSNVGQGFEFFRKYYPNDFYDYILFEPNPHCYQVLVEKYSGLGKNGVQLRNAAVGISSGKIDFFGLEEEKGGIYSVGGTVLPEHNSKIYTVPNIASLKVPSIDFSDFLERKFKESAYSVVILKLDIEGGEYPVLNALISNSQVSKFETIYVEFHSKYMKKEIATIYKDKEKAFLQYAKNVGTRVIEWI